GFQQFHNQVLSHILVYGQLVDHGGIVFNHFFRSPLLACDGGLNRGAVQQHFLFGHPIHSCLFYACISITQNREKYQRRKHFPTHLEALSGGDWIICPACPPTMPEKPCCGWLITTLNA